MNKVAIVTGASRGIGRAIALALKNEGYTVVANCKRNADMLEELGCISHVGDVSSHEYCKELIDFTVERFGRIDVLFHNAGTCKNGLVQELPLEKWDRIMDVNVNAAFYLTRNIVPVMLRQGGGKIVYTSSVWGRTGAAMSSAYSASKGAIDAFTKSVAAELAASNIQVNAIAPGAFDTDMNKGYNEEERQELCDSIPTGRMGNPDEIGKLAVFLADAPQYLTGQIITIDGGWKP